MSKPILIIGSTGQVGSALMLLLKDSALGLDYPAIDLSRPDKISEILEAHDPRTIINAAAYTAVDKAEEEESLALLINGRSPGIIAEFARKKKIPFVHYSTDYVFPGSGNKSWDEEDEPAPINAYGRTKLAGERAVEQAGGDYYIFRTSWVYDERGKNFLRTMLKLMKEREVINVVNDQIGAPTYAGDIARFTLKALEVQKPGLYHLTNKGETNWYDFACEIFEKASGRFELVTKEIKPIPSSAYPTPAKRPLNSRMNLAKFEKTFSVTLPSWQDALDRCFRDISLNYSCL